MTQTMTPNEVARDKGVHPATVRRWIATGVLPAHRVGPRRLRVAVADVDKLITQVA